MKNFFMNKKKLAILTILSLTMLIFFSTVFVSYGSVTGVSIRPDPFVIGVASSDQERSELGKVIHNKTKGKKGFTSVDLTPSKLPKNIDAIWLSNDKLENPNSHLLFEESKKAGKPFFVYGNHLKFKDIAQKLNVQNDLDLVLGPEPGKENDGSDYSIDIVGFKFEDGKVLPSFVISVDKPSDFGEDSYIEGLRNHTKTYGLQGATQMKKVAKANLLSFLVKPAEAGLATTVPNGFSKIYTWDISIYKWIEEQRVSSYHVYEVYKDPTPLDSSYDDYFVTRLDQVKDDSFDIYYNDSRLYPGDQIITSGHLPQDTPWAGSVSVGIIGFELSFSTSAPIEVYNSGSNYSEDRHWFYVDDNEWTDNRLRPGDTWIEAMSYSKSTSITDHYFGNDFWYYIDGVWGKATSAYRGTGSTGDEITWASDEYLWWHFSN